MKNLTLTFVFVLFTSLLLFAQDTYQLEKDIFYRDAGSEELNDYMKERCKLDLYYPENTEDFPTIVWIHGGGLKGGSKHIPKEFLEQKVAVVAINYRLSPRAKAPAFIDDAAAAVAWTFKNIEKFRVYFQRRCIFSRSSCPHEPSFIHNCGL